MESSVFLKDRKSTFSNSEHCSVKYTRCVVNSLKCDKKRLIDRTPGGERLDSAFLKKKKRKKDAVSAFYAWQVGIQCLLKDTTAGQICGEFRESTIFILGLLLISVNVHHLLMQKNHLVSQSSSYTLFIFWSKTSGCHMTLSGALQSDTVALTRHESEQPRSLQLRSQWAQMALQAVIVCPCNQQTQAANSPRRSCWNPMKMKVISQSDLFSSALSGNLKLCAGWMERKTIGCAAFVPSDINTWLIVFFSSLSIERWTWSFKLRFL